MSVNDSLVWAIIGFVIGSMGTMVYITVNEKYKISPDENDNEDDWWKNEDDPPEYIPQ